MTNEAPHNPGSSDPASPTREAPPGALAQFFRGLHFSIFTLWGLVFGAGLSVPIVLDYWRYAFGLELTWVGVIGLGCYLLAVGFLGTWLSLGLLGEWAGRTGGRPLRLAVQVCGILLTASLTIFCAIPLTLLIMGLAGRRQEKRNSWKGAVLFFLVMAVLFAAKVRPALREEVVMRERTERGRAIGAVVERTLDEYDEELSHKTWAVSRTLEEHPNSCHFRLKCIVTRPEDRSEFPMFDLTISCADGDVILVVSRGGTKEDHFLAALKAAMEGRGWMTDIQREGMAVER